jgi:hypothetical protein
MWKGVDIVLHVGCVKAALCWHLSDTLSHSSPPSAFLPFRSVACPKCLPLLNRLTFCVTFALLEANTNS